MAYQSDSSKKNQFPVVINPEETGKLNNVASVDAKQHLRLRASTQVSYKCASTGELPDDFGTQRRPPWAYAQTPRHATPAVRSGNSRSVRLQDVYTDTLYTGRLTTDHSNQQWRQMQLQTADVPDAEIYSPVNALTEEQPYVAHSRLSSSFSPSPDALQHPQDRHQLLVVADSPKSDLPSLSSLSRHGSPRSSTFPSQSDGPLLSPWASPSTDISQPWNVLPDQNSKQDLMLSMPQNGLRADLCPVTQNASTLHLPEPSDTHKDQRTLLAEHVPPALIPTAPPQQMTSGLQGPVSSGTIETPRKRFECSECMFSATLKKDLRRHLSSKHQLLKHRCCLCGVQLCRRDGLLRHMQNPKLHIMHRLQGINPLDYY